MQHVMLAQDDHLEMLELTESAATSAGGYRISRKPDLFALPQMIGEESTYYGIRHRGRLVAMAGIVRQPRYIQGAIHDTLYLFDVCSAADTTSRMACCRLVIALRERYHASPGWMFSTIADTHRHAPLLTQTSRVLPQIRRLGTVVHMGFPLFTGSRRAATKVQPITAGEAWQFYHANAPGIAFAPAGEDSFCWPGGLFLGIEHNGALVSICKVVDQREARNAILDRTNSMSERLASIYCRVRRMPGLPLRNDALRQVTLAYYLSTTTAHHHQDYLAWLRRYYASRYTYAVAGMDPDTAAQHRGMFVHRSESGIYGYGNVPDTHYGFPELTLA